MKWCRFQAGDTATYGLIEGDTVIAINGSPFDVWTRTPQTYPLATVKLLVPVIPPSFYAAGINFREHVTAAAKKRGEEPKFPLCRRRVSRQQRADRQREAIVIPKMLRSWCSTKASWSRSLAEVPQGSQAEALDYVFGYTIGNDVSERVWQRNDRTLWRGKNADTFKPMGPWIVTDLDPDALHVTIRLSNRVVGQYDVKAAIFSVRQFISRMSQYLTLYPGDVLWMGTDGDPENMKDGDVVEVEINDIGVLRNPVVRER
jgi:2-keto-4-pentenoate hydratase/2-oxohepta-3-ene-1,7-dioic acid hydratase in catechol pathway